MAVETEEEAQALSQADYDAMSWDEYENLPEPVRQVLDKRVEDGELKDTDGETVKDALSAMESGEELTKEQQQALTDFPGVEFEDSDDIGGVDLPS
jgi:hypothetical protein